MIDPVDPDDPFHGRGELDSREDGTLPGEFDNLGRVVEGVETTADELWNIIDDRLRMGVSLEDQPVAAVGVTQLALPTDTFTHDDPFAHIDIGATLANGSALPEYVIFDENSQTFSVDGEAAVAAGITEINLQINGSDGQGESASGSFRIVVLGENGEPLTGVAGTIGGTEESDSEGYVTGGDDEVLGDTRNFVAAPEEDTDADSTVPAANESDRESEIAAGASEDTAVVRLTVSVDNQRVLSEGSSTIALPANTFEHSDPTQTITVTATLEDGSDLPGYVEFDEETMTFEVNGQAAAAAGDERIAILLIGQDVYGNSASGVFVIDVLDLEEALADIVDDAEIPLISDIKDGSPESEPQLEEPEYPGELELIEDEDQAATEENDDKTGQQADGKNKLDLQLEQASRYNIVDRIEQLLEDIKNLFT